MGNATANNSSHFLKNTMYWGHFILLWNLYLVKGVWSEVTEVLVEEGSQAVLPCHINLQSPAVAQVRWGKRDAGTVWRKDSSGLEYYGIAWTQRGIHHRVRCPHTGFSVGNYSLYMTNVTEKDGGLYSCSAEGKGQFVTLRVIKVSIAPSAPVEGSDVVLSCNVTPWPKGATTHWMLNGEPIRPQENQIYDIEGTSAHEVVGPQRVLRSRASQSLAGNWTCVVSTEGNRGEATQHLSVRGIVHPTRDMTRVYAAVGSAVTLPCVFSHGAIPSNPVWEKTSGGLNPTSFQLPPSSSSSSSSSSQSPWDVSASLGFIVPDHQGTYRCSGMMEGRRLTRRLQLVISHVESNKGDPEMLTCQLSDDSEVTQYEWVHITQDTNGIPIVTSKQQGRVLRIPGVTETLGEWACCFYGKKGMLGNATYPTEKISGLSGHSEPQLSTNTPTVLALSVLVVLLLLILAQMCKTHKMEQKILQYPALEAMVHAMATRRFGAGEEPCG